MSTNARLSAGVAKDYAELLEGLSALVLEFIRKRDVAGVRRWSSSLAHVGFTLLEHAAAQTKSGSRISAP